VIRSFASKDAERLFEGERVRKWVRLESGIMRKLAMLHRAAALDDLRIPPGNRLEALKGDRAGQHSIRINDQYRICFVWRGGDAHEVEIVDYHR
jgi:proteic killer suppression protein